MRTAARVLVVGCSVIVGLWLAECAGLLPEDLLGLMVRASEGEIGPWDYVGEGYLTPTPSFIGSGGYVKIVVFRYYTSLSPFISGCGAGVTTYDLATTRTYSVSATSSVERKDASKISIGLNNTGAGTIGTILGEISSSITKTIGTTVTVTDTVGLTKTDAKTVKEGQCAKLEGWVLTYRALIIWYDTDLYFNDSASAVLIWYTNNIRVESEFANCSAKVPCPLKADTAYRRRPAP